MRTVRHKEQGMSLTEFDRRLITATQGMPLVSRPYAQVAAQLGVAEAVVRERLAGMLDED